MKPRLYDPRTGHRITAERHRDLLAQAKRQHAAAIARLHVAEDHLDRVRRRDAVLRWQRRAAHADAARARWLDLIRALEEQLRMKTVEYEAKIAYTSSKDKTARVNANLRMQFQGTRLPTDRETRVAFATLIVEGKVKKGWKWAAIDWRNVRRGASTEWQTSADPADLDWLTTIWVGGDMHLDDLTIGEVEEA